MTGRLLGGFIGLLVIILLGMFIAGQIARHRLADRFPPPGKMLQLAGYRLHVHCEGNGPVTVLMEAGLNDFSVQWNRVQALLAEDTSSCSYDRAGLGWSDPSPNPPTIGYAVEDLHAVLQSTDRRSRLILVGHSYGSLLVRMYAQKYPQDVRAIILLDPTSEFMPERVPGYAEALDAAAEQFGRLATFASLGLIALAPEKIPANQLQGNALKQYRARVASGHFFQAAAAETAEMIRNLEAMQRIPQTALAGVPIVIISRGQPEPIPGLPEQSARTLEQSWAALQADLVARLGAEQLTAERSGHNIHLVQPALVRETVESMLNRTTPIDPNPTLRNKAQ